MLIECFTGTEPQPVSVRVHRSQGRRSLSNHRWMPTERRRGHARAEIACSALGNGRQNVPDKGGLSLCGNPRLEVVCGHDSGKTTGFSVRRQCDGFRGSKLLEHGGVTDLKVCGHAATISAHQRRQPDG